MGAMEENKEFTEQDRKDALEQTLTGISKPYETQFGMVAHRHPSLDESRQADYYYSQELFRALRDGVPTEKEMLKQLEEHGVWTKEHEAQVEKLQKDINDLLAQLQKNAKKKGVAESIQKRIDELQDQLNALLAERNFYMNMTAEARARDYRLSYLVWCCTINPETKERVWPTFKDFLNERNQEALGPIIAKCLAWLSGIPDDLLDSSPQAASEAKED